MQEMRTFAIDVPGVCQSVCHAAKFTQLCYANTAEGIEVLLGVETHGDLRNTVLDGESLFLHGFDAAFAKVF